MKKFSVIIPTMWKSKKLNEMLEIYQNNDQIAEIILIDNNPPCKINVKAFPKIIYHSFGKNIFVNPAWNFGAAIAKHEIILANDDIFIFNLAEILDLISLSKYDIIGISTVNTGRNTEIVPVSTFPGKGYGCFIYVRNYLYIPDQLKIWYGDNIQFQHNIKKGMIINPVGEFEISATINSKPEFFRRQVGRDDVSVWQELNKSSDFNFIIRTSNRPSYFMNCINSIKRYRPDARLHIVSDCDDDLDYILKYTKRFHAVVYRVQRDIVEKIALKTDIQRNPFIYNYYFNIVRQFIKGWVMILDDDDELISTPEITEMHPGTIQLHKVDVGHKVVPSKINRPPVLNDISGLGILFHSSDMVLFKPQRGGDFDFISEMYNKCQTKWTDKIIASVQLKGNFGDRSDLKDKPITVNMATFPKRKESFKKVIYELLKFKFIDLIRVYLNNYKSIPDDLPKSERIYYHIGEIDLKDSGKFFWSTEKRNEYYFTADDDLIYTEEYFCNHIKTLRRYNNKIIVTSHAKVLREKPQAFNDCTLSIRCLNEWDSDTWVNQPGTGVMAFSLTDIQIPQIFKYHGMADMWIAWLSQKNNIPLLCRKHNANELKYIDQGDDTLFEKRFALHEDHLKIINDVDKWKICRYNSN